MGPRSSVSLECGARAPLNSAFGAAHGHGSGTGESLYRPCAQLLSRDGAPVVPVMVDSPDYGDGHDLPHGETCDCRDCIPDAALE